LQRSSLGRFSLAGGRVVRIFCGVFASISFSSSMTIGDGVVVVVVVEVVVVDVVVVVVVVVVVGVVGGSVLSISGLSGGRVSAFDHGDSTSLSPLG